VRVFDIANNKYRMIAAIHYDFPRVFVLRIFDDDEYDKDKWILRNIFGVSPAAFL
jgi:mRNA-degrading endonuclease HigB of HigAB toxin-antitoxin module